MHLIILVLLSVPIVAAADTLVYDGEGQPSSPLIDDYAGTNFDDGLWDAVYHIESFNNNMFGGTSIWGVRTPDEPVDMYQCDGWTGYWTSSLAGLDATYLPDLSGEPAAVWKWSGLPPTDASYFHYQSGIPTKYQQVYNGYEDPGWNGTGWTTYSTPEPASAALLGLCFVGIGIWRKRQGRARP